MRIFNLTEEYYSEFFKFNEKVSPRRKKIPERFEFQFLSNPLLKDKTKPDVLIAVCEDNQIIGQITLSPAEFFFNGKKNKCFFAHDLYVLNNYRHKGVGKSLVSNAILNCSPYFGISISEISRKIHLSLNIKTIGTLHKFLWIKNIFSIPTMTKAMYNRVLNKNEMSAFEKNKFKEPKLPDELSIKNIKFKRAYFLENWEEHCWNKSILEFARSKDFLRWRFLKMPEIYYLYFLNDNSRSYFVVRKSNRGGLNLLAIVDYRVPFQDVEKFRLILKAAKLLTKVIGFDGVITMSSLSFFDAELKKSLFFRIGNPDLIISNAKINFDHKAIKKRNVVYATMADSDVDLFFDQAAEIFG